MIGSILAAAGAMALLPLAGVGGAPALMVVLGIGLGMAEPLTMAWVADMAAPNAQGAALGLRLTANLLAQTAVPLGIGVVSAGPGANGVFWSTAVLLGAASAALLQVPPDNASDTGPQA